MSTPQPPRARTTSWRKDEGWTWERSPLAHSDCTGHIQQQRSLPRILGAIPSSGAVLLPPATLEFPVSDLSSTLLLYMVEGGGTLGSTRSYVGQVAIPLSSFPDWNLPSRSPATLLRVARQRLLRLEGWFWLLPLDKDEELAFAGLSPACLVQKQSQLGRAVHIKCELKIPNTPLPACVGMMAAPARCSARNANAPNRGLQSLQSTVSKISEQMTRCFEAFQRLQSFVVTWGVWLDQPAARGGLLLLLYHLCIHGQLYTIPLFLGVVITVLSLRAKPARMALDPAMRLDKESDEESMRATARKVNNVLVNMLWFVQQLGDVLEKMDNALNWSDWRVTTVLLVLMWCVMLSTALALKVLLWLDLHLGFLIFPLAALYLTSPLWKRAELSVFDGAPPLGLPALPERRGWRSLFAWLRWLFQASDYDQIVLRRVLSHIPTNEEMSRRKMAHYQWVRTREDGKPDYKAGYQPVFQSEGNEDKAAKDEKDGWTTVSNSPENGQADSPSKANQPMHLLSARPQPERHVTKRNSRTSLSYPMSAPGTPAKSDSGGFIPSSLLSKLTAETLTSKRKEL
eukprot:g67245.t1